MKSLIKQYKNKNIFYDIGTKTPIKLKVNHIKENITELFIDDNVVEDVDHSISEDGKTFYRLIPNLITIR